MCGLSFDCSVMCVQFVPKTHMFFTCGRDGKVKQWDADCYERILTLEVTCLPIQISQIKGLSRIVNIIKTYTQYSFCDSLPIEFFENVDFY